MKTTITDGISYHNNKLNFNFNDNKIGDKIDLSFILNSVKLKDDIKCYYIYDKNNNYSLGSLLRDLKQFNSNNQDSLWLLRRSSIFVFNYLQKNNILPDVIIIPPSSSEFNILFANELKVKISNKNIKIINSLTKSPTMSIIRDEIDKIKDESIKQSILNYYHNKKNKLTKVNYIYPPYRRFFKFNISIDDAELLNLKNKNVLVIDDFVNSGKTLNSIIDELNTVDDINISVFAIFGNKNVPTSTYNKKISTNSIKVYHGNNTFVDDDKDIFNNLYFYIDDKNISKLLYTNISSSIIHYNTLQTISFKNKTLKEDKSFIINVIKTFMKSKKTDLLKISDVSINNKIVNFYFSLIDTSE